MTIRLRWLGGCVLLLAASTHAATPCDETIADVASMEWDELFETAWMLDYCVEARMAAADRLENMLAFEALPDDVDAENFGQSLLMLSVARLRDDLVRGDVDGAQVRLSALMRELEADADANAVDGAGELLDLLTPVYRVLGGDAWPPLETAIASPEPDWLLLEGRCGMGGLAFDLLPTSADAWHATGRDDVAVQALLLEHWSNAIANGRLPPRLRDYADRAFGAGAFDRELEAALAAIRIRHTPAGRYASMPLFGIDVPLPLGVRSWRDDATTWWTDEPTLRECMRERVADDDAETD